MTPFLKWPGGKRWLLNHGLPQPAGYRRLVEPFLGGGAVFFGLEPPSALIADINPELINLYEVVRDAPQKLADVLGWHQERHSKEHFYATRSEVCDTPVKMAARTLYLNRTCWNGLYRLNKAGQFNVPIGTKTAVVMESDDFLSASQILQLADIKCQDFQSTIDATEDGDFLFVDPPYTVKHNVNGFLKYNEHIFAWDDQVRLVSSLERASLRGVSIVVTNADHQSVRELYQNGFQFRSLVRHSVLAGIGSARGLTTEALFTANI
jgi:DNA adenine methylase